MAISPVTEEAASPALESPRTPWEIPLAACLSALFFAAFLVVPLFGALGFPFAAVPPVRVTHRRGLAAGLVATILAAGILFGVALASAGWREAAGVVAAALLVTGLPVLFAGRVRRGSDSSRAFLTLALGGCLLLSGILVAIPLAGRPPVESELRSAFDAMIPAALESYRHGNADPETMERVRTTLIAARDFAGRYWAGLIGGCWILGSAVAFYAGARLARPSASAGTVRFEALEIPAGVAGLFVAAGVAFAFLDGLPRTVAGDVLLALAALYFVAGLSIICHFARRWFRTRILRLVLYVPAAYFPMSLGVALLGLFDWYLHLRRRGEKGETRR
ncbi:MAG: DUF2232 domain-containing protein [Acidobacteriota bacterium]